MKKGFDVLFDTHNGWMRMKDQGSPNGPHCLHQSKNEATLEKCTDTHSSKKALSNFKLSLILPLFPKPRESQRGTIARKSRRKD